MKHLSKALMVAGGAIALFGASAAVSQASDDRPKSIRSAQVSDDIGPDGLKRRGDGSIDDSQAGLMPGDWSFNEDSGLDGLERRGDGSIDDDNYRSHDHHQDRLHRSGRDRDRDDRHEQGRDHDRADRGDWFDDEGRGRGRGRGRDY